MTNNFLKQIGKIPLLSRDEEIALAKRIKAGDDKAREQMISANLRLVISVAKKYKCNSLDFEDLISEGVIGLIHGIEKFDHTKGFKLSTYVVWWIKQAILSAIEEKSRTIRRPVYTTVLQNKIRKAKEAFIAETSSEPTLEDIVDVLDISIEKYYAVMSLPYEPISLDANATGSTEFNHDASNGRKLSEIIKDNNAFLPDDFVHSQEIIETTKRAFSKLSEREEKIVRMRFGIDYVDEGDFEITEEELNKIKCNK